MYNAIEFNKNIKAFHFEVGEIIDEKVKAISNIIKNKTITTVSIDANNIFNDGIKSISNAILSNSNVRSLYFVSSFIYGSDANILVESLKNAKNLKTLFIGSNRLKNKIIKPISDLMIHNLSSLFLHGSNIDYSGLMELSNVVKTCKALTTLYFSSNSITDGKGLTALIEAVKSNLNISSFGISSDSLYEASDDKFADLIKQCNHIISRAIIDGREFIII